MAFLRSAIFFAVVLCASFGCGADPKPIEIPLKDIWASIMLGTKDVRDLEPDVWKQGLPDDVRDQRLKESLFARVGKGSPPQEPEEGFAVTGIGKDALRAAAQQPHEKTFSPNDEISIVFFSYTFGDYVHLDHVERQGTTVSIYYRFVPHYTKEVTSHFALIPLGKLPPGKYDVKIIQLPIDSPLAPLDTRPVPEAANLVDEKAGSKYICKPFSFSVNKD